MEDKPTAIETLLERAEDYTRTSIELAKLQAIDKIADIGSSVISMLVISLAVGMFLIMFNIGIAMWLGEMLGNQYLGFFAVSGFYLLVALILIAGKKSLIKIPVSDSMIIGMLKQKVR